jgi:Tfp pilus assembly protein PilO
MLVIDFMLKLNSPMVSKIFVRCYRIAVCCCLHLWILGPGFGGYSAHSTGGIEELLQEDPEVKRCCEQCQQQAAALSKLTQQLSIHSGKISCLGNHTLHIVRFYSTPR